MPIRPYIGTETFDPELTQAMGKAFERACVELGLTAGKRDQMTTVVAEHVIACAEAGETDPQRMADFVLDKLKRRAE